MRRQGVGQRATLADSLAHLGEHPFGRGARLLVKLGGEKSRRAQLGACGPRAVGVNYALDRAAAGIESPISKYGHSLITAGRSGLVDIFLRDAEQFFD